MLLPTVHAWPAIATALDALLSQATSLQFEVLVLDGHGAALCDPPAHYALRWLRFPGSDTFALRAAGVAAARGSIIAVTEDHCVTPPDWIESIVAAHRADTTLALIGPVINHTESAVAAIDRANFLLTFAGQTRARLAIRRDRLPVPTNLSFKRAALPTAGLAPGELEYVWLAQLRDDGALGVTRSVVLEHNQCWGRAAPAVHCASGRSYGASIRAWPWKSRLWWWLNVPLLPLRMFRFVLPDLVRHAAGAPVSIGDVMSLATLISANVFGQAMGVLFGPGASRRRL